MDYTNYSFGFKIKKALRYIRLYGIRRTIIKIKGQYHMKRRFASLPKLESPPQEGGCVGLIGCGNFAFSNIAYFLHKNYGCVLRGAMDVDIHKAASLFENYGLKYYTNDPKKIIDDPAIALVYIASNHATHAEYAIAALESGKNVHIEKPHVVTSNQLVRLCSAMATSKGKVSLGFNRPNSKMGIRIKQALDSQSGSSIYNWFIAGHAIDPEHWYFREEEGGRILGNLCHWTDFIYQLVQPEHRYPIAIKPTRSTKSDCDVAVNYIFGDGSIAALTFSAKGHTFEGVRERFAAHRGNLLISMDDFKNLIIEENEKKKVTNQFHRDHGHNQCIKNSYEMVFSKNKSENYGCSIAYVWETGQLFLKTKEALESDRTIILHPYEYDGLTK